MFAKEDISLLSKFERVVPEVNFFAAETLKTHAFDEFQFFLHEELIFSLKSPL